MTRSSWMNLTLSPELYILLALNISMREFDEDSTPTFNFSTGSRNVLFFVLKSSSNLIFLTSTKFVCRALSCLVLFGFLGAFFFLDLITTVDKANAGALARRFFLRLLLSDETLSFDSSSVLKPFSSSKETKLIDETELTSSSDMLTVDCVSPTLLWAKDG